MPRTPLAGLLLALFAACGGVDDPDGTDSEAAGAAASALFRYNREYVFVADRNDEPLVVPFTFRASERDGELARVVQAWLARGGTWERFLDETASTSGAGGVWRVVPYPDLRITVGGPAEIDALRFERGERRLRLELQNPLTSWSQGGETRFRIVEGELAVGAELLPGNVLEILRVERTEGDGWPPGQDFDALFLTSGDSLQLVLAETLDGSEPSEQYAWVRGPGGERMWPEAEVRWLELRPYEEARRDIPRRWSFRIPGSGISGEVEAAGFDAVLGPERAGRRAVEIRYSVTGWIEVQGERTEVVGMIRHTQR